MGVTVPLAIVAHIFRNTIRKLSLITTQLDAQVNTRTAELQRIISLRESDIAAIVHDIHNRMTVVRAEIDVLILDAADAGGDAQNLMQTERRITNAISSVGDLVEDLRTAAQLDNRALRLQLYPLDIVGLVEHVVDQHITTATQVRCRLDLELVGMIPIVQGDRRKLERVLSNLIGNAIKYTSRMPVNKRFIQVRLETADDGVMITIADSGPGLDAEAIARIGQPFTRLASSRGTEGMGIGIYISKGIIELHKGLLTYSSEGINQGTQVRLWLPVMPMQALEEVVSSATM